MNIIQRYKIKTEADIVFSKIDIKNYFKRIDDNFEYIDFFIFVLMELSTNLVKYTDGGEIWLIEKDKKYSLASCDKGKGIKDLDSALCSGYTTSKNSLGLGLFQIANNSKYNMQIFTQTDSNNSGTVVLVTQKDTDENIVHLTKPYMDLEQNGDYIISKGRYILFGDASGHGIKAQKSANEIKEFFLDNFMSFSLAKDFCNSLHKYLKANYLRSTVLSIIEKNSNKIQISGVGNLDIWIEESLGFHRKTFRDGIVGEVFSDLSTHSFELYKKQKLILTTDGFDSKRTKEFLDSLTYSYSPLMLGVSMLHFLSSDMDDNSILIFEEK